MSDVPREIAELMARLAPSPGGVQHDDIGDAVRPVFFQTNYEEFLYATDGGTLFLVRFKGKIYGITARHVFTGNGFEPKRLFVTRKKYAKKGTLPAPATGFYYSSAPHGAAAGTDIDDLCVIEFDEDMVIGYCQLEYGDTTKATREAVIREAKPNSWLRPSAALPGSAAHPSTTRLRASSAAW